MKQGLESKYLKSETYHLQLGVQLLVVYVQHAAQFDLKRWDQYNNCRIQFNSILFI